MCAWTGGAVIRPAIPCGNDTSKRKGVTQKRAESFPLAVKTTNCLIFFLAQHNLWVAMLTVDSVFMATKCLLCGLEEILLSKFMPTQTVIETWTWMGSPVLATTWMLSRGWDIPQ